MWKIIVGWLKWIVGVIVPFARDEEAKVAPAVQAEIDRIRKKAVDEVAALQAHHDVKNILAQAEADAEKVLAFAKQHAEFIRMQAQMAVTVASNKWPPVLEQLGLTGPSGTTGTAS